MKTDAQLRSEILKELDWDSSLNARAVGVAVKDGIVTLSGHLDTHAEKHALEDAVGRVKGVRAIALEVDVKLDPGHRRSDSEIAAAAEAALTWHARIPADRILVTVEQGWITLTGEVDWGYQRNAVCGAAWAAPGVSAVVNELRVES